MAAEKNDPILNAVEFVTSQLRLGVSSPDICKILVNHKVSENLSKTIVYLVEFVSAHLRLGISFEEIQKQLLKHGIQESLARTVIDRLCVECSSKDKTVWLLINYCEVFRAAFPFGLAYISSTLKSDPRLSVHCLDLVKISPALYHDVITKKLVETGAGVVGISGYSDYFSAIKELTTHIRRRHPTVTLVAGGPVVSSEPVFAHEKLGLDFAVFGEGEETVLELVDHLLEGTPPQEIAGLVFRDAEGHSVKNCERKSKKDIDDLPWPDWKGWDFEFYIRVDYDNGDPQQTHVDFPRSAPILLSRSCPYLCTFCAHSIKTYRMRKMDRVFEEIDALVEKYNINGLNIYDDLFAVNLKRISEFCIRITPYNLFWRTQMRPNISDKPNFSEVLAEMRDAKCCGIGYGLESMNDDVLLSMRKRTTVNQADKAMRLTYDHYITAEGNLIFGDIRETLETANDSMNWWAKNRCYSAALVQIIILPGTELYQTAMLSGKITDSEENFGRCREDVNASLIEDQDFHELVKSIGDVASLNIPAHVTKIERSPVDGERVQVTAICPHCGQIQVYAHVKFRSKIVLCRTCCAKFHISQERMSWRTLAPAHHVNLLMQASQLLQNHRQCVTATIQQQVETIIRQVEVEVNDDIDVHALRGTAALLCGQKEIAKLEFQRGMNRASTSPELQNNHGIVLCMAGQIGWGLLRFQQAWAINPQCMEARANAQLVVEYLLKHGFTAIPFFQRCLDFPQDKLQIIIPNVSSSSPVFLWPPLRTCSDNPLSSQLLDLTQAGRFRF